MGPPRPEKNKTYRGRIVFAIGCYDSGDLNPTTLVCEFKTRQGKELDSSPWFYGTLQDFLFSLDDARDTGCVYEFKGTFRNFVFKGTVTRICDFNRLTQ